MSSWAPPLLCDGERLGELQGSVSLVSVCDAVMCEAISGSLTVTFSTDTRHLDAPGIITHQ